MAVLNTLVKYYPPTDINNPIILDDVLEININKGSSVQNNKARITLKNYQVAKLSDGTFQHSGSDEDGFIKYETDGILKVWATYDEGSGLNTSATSSDLLFVGDLLNTKVEQNQNGQNNMVLEFADRTYTILNRVWVESFESTPVPNIIQSVIRATTDHAIKPNDELYDSQGTLGGDGAGGLFEIDARLESEGGFIEDTRSDGSAFPTVDLALVYKPVYNWLEELSSVEMTNSPAEISANSYVQKRAMLYYVDELNKFHWFYPDSGNPQHELLAGATTAQGSDSNTHYIYGHTAKRNTDEIVNFIVYQAGEDMNGKIIENYYYDPSAGAPIPKDSYRAWFDIALNMKQQDELAGFLTRNNSNDSQSFAIATAQFPFVPTWDRNGVSVSSSTAYNANFIDEAEARANGRAQMEVQQRSNLRLKDPMRIRGSNVIGVGDLLKFTSPAAGERKVNVRVKEVTHVINQTGWTTEVTFEEDEPELVV